MVCLMSGPHFVAALRSCERVTTRGEGRMFYMRVPGARSGFLLFVADHVCVVLEARSVAAFCMRVFAFTRAGVVAFPWAGPSCGHASFLPLRCAGDAGIGGEGGGDGGRALDVRALFELGLWCVGFP